MFLAASGLCAFICERLNGVDGNIFKVFELYRSYRIERSLSGKKPTVESDVQIPESK